MKIPVSKGFPYISHKYNQVIKIESKILQKQERVGSLCGLKTYSNYT